VTVDVSVLLCESLAVGVAGLLGVDVTDVRFSAVWDGVAVDVLTSTVAVLVRVFVAVLVDVRVAGLALVGVGDDVRVAVRVSVMVGRCVLLGTGLDVAVVVRVVVLVWRIVAVAVRRVAVAVAVALAICEGTGDGVSVLLGRGVTEIPSVAVTRGVEELFAVFAGLLISCVRVPVATSATCCTSVGGSVPRASSVS
jgi:hypothetical protein